MTEATSKPLALTVLPDADSAVESLAHYFVERAAAAIAARGEFRVALSGGGTPKPLYERLAQPEIAERIEWSKVHVFFCDERCVPQDDAASNAALVRTSLTDHVGLPAGQLYPMDGTLPPAEGAAAYALVLGDKPLDLALLGMGGDGHTASLFPGGAELEVRDARASAATSPIEPANRITLTLKALGEAREMAFLALGAGKAARLAEVERQVRSTAVLPAALASAAGPRARWFVDHAAIADLDEGGAAGLADFGMIGLAVMGRNLALNVMDRGFDVAVWNLEPEMTRSAVEESQGGLTGTATLAELVASLERPRRIMMMIMAGKPVDMVLDALEPLLDEGDIVIDGGNSWFEDTRRREQRMTKAGLRFVGVGVSGGEEGARNGPALMPGGDAEAWKRIQPVMEAIAAKTEHGACVTHVGADGAGHFVKMVHNGIEYADMQFIAEAYDVMQRRLGMAPPELAATFARWNEGPLASFLVEITASILAKEDPEKPGSWLVDRVLDRAGQKGTGRMTAQVALDLGVSVPSIAAAIDARVLSSMKKDRERYEPLLAGPPPTEPGITVDDVESALLAAKIGAYAQGMALIMEGAKHYGWTINPTEIARIWTGGCIIRARFLETMMNTWKADPGLSNLLVGDSIRQVLDQHQAPWRRVVSSAVTGGIPVPGMAASLAYYDALRTARLPQNLVQAQRDAFGAHTYQTVEDPDGAFVHSEWL